MSNTLMRPSPTCLAPRLLAPHLSTCPNRLTDSLLAVEKISLIKSPFEKTVSRSRLYAVWFREPLSVEGAPMSRQ
jgi:hypothetical protein